jgi:hypothetical protein
MKTVAGGLAVLALVLGASGCEPSALRNVSDECEVDRVCGVYTGVNCRSEVDGAYYYVESATGTIVATCGGACMAPSPGQCEKCAPSDWGCSAP